MEEFHKLCRYLLICLPMDGNMAPRVWGQCSHREICTQKGPLLVIPCSVVLVIRYSSYKFSLNLHIVNQLPMIMEQASGAQKLGPASHGLSASSKWFLKLLSLCSQLLFTAPALLSFSCYYCCHLPPRAASYFGLRVCKSPSASTPGRTPEHWSIVDDCWTRICGIWGAKWGNGCSGNSFSRWVVSPSSPFLISRLSIAWGN